MKNKQIVDNKKLFQKILKECPDSVSIDSVFKSIGKKRLVKYFNYECGINGKERKFRGEQGIEIRWSKSGYGFGTIKISEKDGKLFINTESMGKDFAVLILLSLIIKATVSG